MLNVLFMVANVGCVSSQQGLYFYIVVSVFTEDCLFRHDTWRYQNNASLKLHMFWKKKSRAILPLTRMHSSRLRTVRSSSHLLGEGGRGGGVCPGSVCPGSVCPGGLCVCPEGCLPTGGVCPGGCIPACTGADTPTCGQNDRCKNITFLQLPLRRVKMFW